jgi:hypothetical protein
MTEQEQLYILFRPDQWAPDGWMAMRLVETGHIINGKTVYQATVVFLSRDHVTYGSAERHQRHKIGDKFMMDSSPQMLSAKFPRTYKIVTLKELEILRFADELSGAKD